MTATLRAFLVNSSRALGVEPRHLNDPAADGDVQTALLKDAIALREMGHAERSLGLLAAAAEAGLASDWIEDNRARALLALGRRGEAQALFQTLSACGTEAVAAAALEQLAAFGDATPAPAPAPTAEPIDPTPLLEQAIALRENGELQASLELLDQAKADGLQSPWIEDNRARALVRLERRAEALAIWEALAEGDDEGVRGMAAEMVERQRQQLSPLEAHVLAGSDLSAELKAELDAAIALRESGQAQASLELLDRLTADGQRSPWLASNRARALLLLDRRDEARAIWQALLGSAHEAVVGAAERMLQELEREQLRACRDQLLQLAEDTTVGLEALAAAEPQRLSDLERPLLEDAIGLREAGESALSLQLLEQAQAHGLQSPWIEDNRARALVQLERRAEALAIWEALAEGDDESVRGMAAEMAERQRSRVVEDTTAQLRQLLQREGRVVQHLPEAAPGQLQELEMPLLKEAIALREVGDFDLSLQLLEAAVASGLHSGWIDDNRARVLVNLERYSEAVDLWQGLLDSDSPALQDCARDMLELNEARGREQGVLLAVDRLIDDADDKQDGVQKALDTLTDAVLADPENSALQTRLGELALSIDQGEGRADATFPELQHHRQVLAGFDAFLSILETRDQDAEAAAP